jgi:GT2 family glycosyltransferase
MTTLATVSEPTSGTVPNQRVSVVMITRNRRTQVMSTLRHLTALPDQPPIVVVDNASTDGTADAVARCFPEVVCIRRTSNDGAVGRTIGVRAADTPYIAFSDDDSWWAPHALDTAADHFDSSPRLALLAARMLVGTAEVLDPVCQEMADSPLPRQPDLPGPSVLGFVACGAVVRRSAYLQAGGFHPVIGFGGEETVLAQDLAAAGWGLAYVDDVVAHHHPIRNPDRSNRLGVVARNDLLSVWLRRPLRIALSRSLRTVRAAARTDDAQARAVLLGALRRLPDALRARQVLSPQVEGQIRLLENKDV